MTAIAAGLQLILNKIIGWAGWLLSVFIQVFVDAWEFFTDGFVWVFDQVLALVVSIVDGASELPGFSEVQTGALTVGTLPGEMLNMLGLLGVGYALGIIASALTIRFLLGLIPFVRVGG